MVLMQIKSNLCVQGSTTLSCIVFGRQTSNPLCFSTRTFRVWQSGKGLYLYLCLHAYCVLYVYSIEVVDVWTAPFVPKGDEEGAPALNAALRQFAFDRWQRPPFSSPGQGLSLASWEPHNIHGLHLMFGWLVGKQNWAIGPDECVHRNLPSNNTELKLFRAGCTPLPRICMFSWPTNECLSARGIFVAFSDVNHPSVAVSNVAYLWCLNSDAQMFKLFTKSPNPKFLHEKPPPEVKIHKSKIVFQISRMWWHQIPKSH